MNFRIISLGLRKGAMAVSKHAPLLLTILGSGGVITTAVFAVKATPKAMRLMDEKKEKEQVDRLSKLEIIKTCWKPYIPTMLMAAATIGCFAGAHGISVKRQAAIASLYSVTEKTLKEYQEKVTEKFGEKEEKQIRREIAKDHLNKHPIDRNNLIVTGYGDTITVDKLSGQQFICSIPKVNDVQASINSRIASQMFISQNEFYDMIGLKRVPTGDDVGWTIDNPLILHWLFPDETQPVMYLEYETYPEHDFNKII